MYFVILFYGMNVARSIIEEKTSRIFEVLLATIRPERCWRARSSASERSGSRRSVSGWLRVWRIQAPADCGQTISISPHLGRRCIFFIVFFLLGYLLYSSVAAALGAMTSSEQELQQMNIFLMLPLIACSMVIYRVVTEPDGMHGEGLLVLPLLHAADHVCAHRGEAATLVSRSRISIGELVLTHLRRALDCLTHLPRRCADVRQATRTCRRLSAG